MYTSPFTTRNQEIKTLEKLDQAIKQASRDESSGQASISTIKNLDCCRSWKYRAHSSDYPLIIGLVYSMNDALVFANDPMHLYFISTEKNKIDRIQSQEKVALSNE